LRRIPHDLGRGHVDTGGAMRNAMASSCATFAARTGCSLLGTMYFRIDSIQCARRAGALACRTAAGFCAERRISSRSKPSRATACSSRLPRPRLRASGSRPGACGNTTASVRTPLARSHAASAGSCAGDGVHKARSRS
jgi:hypothetical protein